MMDRIDDLPAPERPISRTLRCLWRRLRSMVLISEVILVRNPEFYAARVAVGRSSDCFIALVNVAEDISSTGP
jgi:hypothetical protein